MNKTIIVEKKKIKRKVDIPCNLLTIVPAIALNKLFLTIPFEGDIDAKKIIRNKLSSYIMQDKKKQRFNPKKIINYDQLIEKMVESTMKCCFCRHSLLLFYIFAREPYQWTLDRIDNTKGHNKDNVAIACLKCNLERRRQDDKKFLFSKRMKIIKMS